MFNTAKQFLFLLTLNIYKFWHNSSYKINNSTKENVNLDDLFDTTRFQRELIFYKKIILFFYFPVGILLVILRLSVILLWSIIFLLLPKKTIIKQIYLKGTCIIFGWISLYRNLQNDHMTDKNIKFVIANHTYSGEFIPLIAKYKMLVSGRIGAIDSWLARLVSPLVPLQVVSILIDNPDYIMESKYPILVFPEGATTNGKVGLLRYQPLIFFYNFPILPISIRVVRPLPIALCKLFLSPLNDLAWTLFQPWIIFEYTFLPVTQLENETPLAYADRVQEMTAKTLGLTATHYTVHDKNKFRALIKNNK